MDVERVLNVLSVLSLLGPDHLIFTPLIMVFDQEGLPRSPSVMLKSPARSGIFSFIWSKIPKPVGGCSCVVAILMRDRVTGISWDTI